MAENINTVDLSELADDLAQAADNVERAMQMLLETAGNEIAAEAQTIVPVDTGNLRNSIGVVASPGRIYVGPNHEQAPYDAFVEYGTGIRGEFPTQEYEIRPKKAKVLAFQVGGKTVFTTVVRHKGQRAQPYMRPATRRWMQSLGEESAQLGVDLIVGEKRVA